MYTIAWLKTLECVPTKQNFMQNKISFIDKLLQNLQQQKKCSIQLAKVALLLFSNQACSRKPPLGQLVVFSRRILLSEGFHHHPRHVFSRLVIVL